jgi:hypothetical protein
MLELHHQRWNLKGREFLWILLLLLPFSLPLPLPLHFNTKFSC